MTTLRGQHLIGQEIGSCVLEEVLGYGGSSAVFRARSLTAHELVAVKVFLPRSTLDGQMRKSFYQRFLREAEAASQLEHPHILSIYAYGEQEGLPYIVMPYMVGGTLAEHVQRQGPLSLHEALRYLTQIGAALDYAHAHGCVHCDVKPANILLDGTGQAALSDFGTVYLVQATETPEAQAAPKQAGTFNEVLMGTPDYVSPEQALGQDLDGRSDIYSLGATLYYLLTGEPPFQAESLIALALMHVHDTVTPLGVLRADVTPQLDRVLAQALAKEAEQRYQTADAFCTAFADSLAATAPDTHPQRTPKQLTSSQSNLAALPQLATPLTPRKTPSEPMHRRTGLMLSLVTLLLLGSLLFAILFSGNVRNNQPTSLPRTQTSSLPHNSLIQTDVLLANQQDWPTSSTFFFQNGRYYIQNKLLPNITSTSLVAAFYANHLFTNFHLSVVTTDTTDTANGADYYGIAFRASADQTHYYLFEITTWEGGQYGFLRFDGAGHWRTLAAGAATGLLSPTGRPNVLDVDAQGNIFTFALNGQKVSKPIPDTASPALSTGSIGLIVEQPNTEVAFSHLFITPLA